MRSGLHWSLINIWKLQVSPLNISWLSGYGKLKGRGKRKSILNASLHWEETWCVCENSFHRFNSMWHISLKSLKTVSRLLLPYPVWFFTTTPSNLSWSLSNSIDTESLFLENSQPASGLLPSVGSSPPHFAHSTFLFAFKSLYRMWLHLTGIKLSPSAWDNLLTNLTGFYDFVTFSGNSWFPEKHCNLTKSLRHFRR